MPRLDRGIQYAAAEVARASSPTLASRILDRPVKPGDDSESGVATAQWLQASAVTIADCRFSSANMILPATTTRTLASATRSTVSGTRVAL